MGENLQGWETDKDDKSIKLFHKTSLQYKTWRKKSILEH